MQLLMSFIAAVAGLAFSLAVALLAEELIFGQVFRRFFAPAPVKSSPQLTRHAEQKREDLCC